VTGGGFLTVVLSEGAIPGAAVGEGGDRTTFG